MKIKARKPKPIMLKAFTFQEIIEDLKNRPEPTPEEEAETDRIIGEMAEKGELRGLIGVYVPRRGAK